jgi:D-alanyl-lipoteichoic acid acyltransferase DltB (MBOAT superfamily)
MVWRIAFALWLFCMLVSMLGGWALWLYIILGLGFQAVCLLEVGNIEYYKKKLPWKDTTKWTRNI